MSIKVCATVRHTDVSVQVCEMSVFFAQEDLQGQRLYGLVEKPDSHTSGQVKGIPNLFSGQDLPLTSWTEQVAKVGIWHNWKEHPESP